MLLSHCNGSLKEEGDIFFSSSDFSTVLVCTRARACKPISPLCNLTSCQYCAVLLAFRADPVREEADRPLALMYGG